MRVVSSLTTTPNVEASSLGCLRAQLQKCQGAFFSRTTMVLQRVKHPISRQCLSEGGGYFGQDPPTRLWTHPDPPPLIILWGAFFVSQNEAKMLSPVRHPSPKR